MGIILPAIYACDWTGEPHTAGTVADGTLPVPFHQKPKAGTKRASFFYGGFPDGYVGKITDSSTLRCVYQAMSIQFPIIQSPAYSTKQENS
ncbi:MAG: hypothetical protein LUD78_07400 [Clostridiales bacterium]|nr:hypothetical protein [Clostridiales bacterium]